MRRLSPAAAALVASLLTAASVSAAEQPDPIQLLEGAAEAVAAAPSASLTLKVSTVLVRDDMKDEGSAQFLYRTAPDGRFEFRSVDEEGNPSKSGYHVAGNGEVVLTALLSGRRHMIEPDAGGVTSFVRSPGAAGIGSGLGGIALAFLHPQAMKDLAGSVQSSEFVGEETIDGEKFWHARYVVGGGIPTDVWFAVEGPHVVRKVVPNVLETAAVKQMGSRFEKFDYQLWFDFLDWNGQAKLASSDLPVVEPKNSRLMESLYRMPESGPHKLLGEVAPEFALPNLEGDKVSLAGELRSEDEATKPAVLVEFWATTCPICIRAMPVLEKVHQKYAERGLRYVAVNVGESSEEVAAFLAQRKLDAPTLLDETTEIAEQYDVQGIPLILLVGADGRVQVAEEGFRPGVTEKRVSEAFEALERGEDPAKTALDAARAAEERRLAELNRLRSKLDG